jgi:Flp pilus assembly protein TadG
MALDIDKENENADAGMSQAIFLKMDRLLSPPLQEAVDNAKDAATKAGAQKALDEARKRWKKLAFSIASGVISYITANMEIFGVTVQGNVTTTVTGNTGTAEPGNHQHNVNLSGVENDVVFTQNNDGTGRVR